MEENKLILFEGEDAETHDLSKIGDFISGFIKNELIEYENINNSNFFQNVNLSDIALSGQISDGLNTLIFNGKRYILDFKHLPEEVKKKLNSGEYRLGESRQVDGNLRAVIVDKNGIGVPRVKDITVTEVSDNSAVFDSIRAIGIQLQFKQINNKLGAIEEFVSYQVDLSRNDQLINPFFNARDYIVKAQNTNDLNERKKYLEKALEYLQNGKTAIRSDINTAGDHLAKLTNSGPLKQWWDGVRGNTTNYIKYLLFDLSMATKYYALEYIVNSYIGKNEDAELSLTGYQKTLEDFFDRPYNNEGHTIMEMIMYNQSGKSGNEKLFDFEKEMRQKVKYKSININKNEKVILISQMEEKPNE